MSRWDRPRFLARHTREGNHWRLEYLLYSGKNWVWTTLALVVGVVVAVNLVRHLY